ncbi:Retrovirus-related pol polyprotein from transposon tnt 1-94 [Abeliophyllum distichum]|uniref:Retrovirus-related pol polyprotein from transposon tnt 1-94 n=1 Tax=Abeliophyllum distichum TaxID=126358 RepID=A0ABD1V4P5_9LAMI
MARVMLNSRKLPVKLWAEAVSTACYVLNRVTIRTGTSQTPYEIWKGRKPNLKYFHTFGSKCYILNDHEQIGKMDPKSDEGIFLGYFENIRASRVYNMRTQNIIESINVVVDDTNDFAEYSQKQVIQTLTEKTEATSEHRNVGKDTDESQNIPEDVTKTNTTKQTEETEQNNTTADSTDTFEDQSTRRQPPT